MRKAVLETTSPKCWHNNGSKVGRGITRVRHEAGVCSTSVQRTCYPLSFHISDKALLGRLTLEKPAGRRKANSRDNLSTHYIEVG